MTGIKIRWLAALPLLALAACSNPITSGTVIGRSDTPAHFETIQVPQYRTQCTTEEEPEYVGGSTQEEPVEVCTQVFAYFLPVTQWVPEDWQLEIRDGSRTGWVDVSSDEYSRYRDGQHWHQEGS